VTLHHAALEAAPADREPLADFFALLGFARVEPPPGLRRAHAAEGGGSQTLWLEREGTQIHVLFADAAVVPPEGHVAVVTPDYEDALARLREAGFSPEPRTPHWGADRCFVRAPGGHRVEVMAAPPGAGA
jgi:catechol 2,3-dioxygenase-like lactoylglutathione lyase family enzyme